MRSFLCFTIIGLCCDIDVADYRSARNDRADRTQLPESRAWGAASVRHRSDRPASAARRAGCGAARDGWRAGRSRTCDRAHPAGGIAFGGRAGAGDLGRRAGGPVRAGAAGGGARAGAADRGGGGGTDVRDPRRSGTRAGAGRRGGRVRGRARLEGLATAAARGGSGRGGGAGGAAAASCRNVDRGAERGGDTLAGGRGAVRARGCDRRRAVLADRRAGALAAGSDPGARRRTGFVACGGFR